MGMSERFKRWWYGDDTWKYMEEFRVALIEMQADLERVQKANREAGRLSMDEVTRMALEQAWDDGYEAGYDSGHWGDAAVSNPYRKAN